MKIYEYELTCDVLSSTISAGDASGWKWSLLFLWLPRRRSMQNPSGSFLSLFFFFEHLIFPFFSQRVTLRERESGGREREREALEECQYDWRERGVCVRCAFDNNSSPAVLFHAHSHDPLLPLTCTAVCECERRRGD